MCNYISESAVLPAGTVLGHNCVIMEKVVVGEGVEIGNNVVLHPGTRIGSGCHIGDNAVLGRQPRSGRTSLRPTRRHPPLCIGNNVIIGTSVVIYAGCVIGDDAMVADLACIREACRIGKGSRIGRCVTMECNTTVGEGTVVQTAAHLTGDMVIEDGVFIGPEVCTMNDKYMAKNSDTELRGPVIRKGAVIGSNATLMAGVKIGEEAVVGAGTVVLRDVAPGCTVVGNPARTIKEGSSPGSVGRDARLIWG